MYAVSRYCSTARRTTGLGGHHRNIALFDAELRVNKETFERLDRVQHPRQYGAVEDFRVAAGKRQAGRGSVLGENRSVLLLAGQSMRNRGESSSFGAKSAYGGALQ